jgi:hypothetical protein
MTTKITYSLSYIKDGQTFQIKDSNITMKAHVQKYASQRLNTANIEIFGLKKESRELIFKDRYDVTNRPLLILEAGFDDINTLVFQGSVLEAYSVKSRAEIRTIIVAQDGIDLVAGSFANVTFSEGKSMRDVVLESINYMGIPSGTIGNLDTTSNQRDFSISGNIYNQMQSMTNNSMFIDGGKINKLDDDELINEIVVLTSNNRFLNTPQRIGQYLNIDLLFTPQVKPGQGVEIKSDYERAYNGVYKVVGIDHNINASGSVIENSTTKLELFAPTTNPFKYV